MCLKIYYEHPKAVYEEKREISWYSLRSFERQFTKRILGHPSVLFVFLAVKRCLGVCFMVFEVGLKLLVLLKGACFALILRLQICEAIWIGYASQKSVFSPWGFFHG